jgi:hypothetical protein
MTIAAMRPLTGKHLAGKAKGRLPRLSPEPDARHDDRLAEPQAVRSNLVTTLLNRSIQMQFRVIDGLSVRFAHHRAPLRRVSLLTRKHINDEDCDEPVERGRRTM